MGLTFDQLVESMKIDLEGELEAILAKANEEDAEIDVADVASGLVAMLQKHYVEPYSRFGKRVEK